MEFFDHPPATHRSAPVSIPIAVRQTVKEGINVMDDETLETFISDSRFTREDDEDAGLVFLRLSKE